MVYCRKKILMLHWVMKGVSADALPSYLDERMWRDRWGSTTEEAFTNICSQISEQYIFINSPFTSVQILVRLDVLSMGSCVWVDEVHGVVDGLVVMQTVFRPIY
jgi:hypothetical protein